MSHPFTFVPRSITNKAPQKRKESTSSKPATQFRPQEGERQPFQNRHKPVSGAHVEKDSQLKEDELLILLELALSDYSCWCNPELQHTMALGRDGYLPLKYLLNESNILSTLAPRPSEADVMRCIRASSNSPLETRMLISEPSRSKWFNRGSGASTSYQSEGGGFEVRRKDWESLLQTLGKGAWNKEWWDQRTIYVERLPAAYRSINAIARYIQSVGTTQDEEPPVKLPKNFVQSVAFPSYYLAPPDEVPRCKGFAFVVLDSPTSVNILCNSYPWEGSSSSHSLDLEASKFGMRILPKTSWERLKTEYLAHQQRLSSQVAESADIPHTREQFEKQVSFYKPRPDSTSPLDVPPSPLAEMPTTPSWYPQKCLVYARNIHPDTNKTTLRVLFSAILASKEALDYVDFNKGLDTCHLRLASPTYAAQLVSHFTAHSTAQNDPLDQVGSTPSKERPKIGLEIVEGKREELYWERVPEKVRNAAVARLNRGFPEEKQTPEEDGGNRKRKRRKNG